MVTNAEQIARLNRLAGFDQPIKAPVLSPYGQGSLRQSPSIPDVVPRNLPSGIPSNPSPSVPLPPQAQQKPAIPTLPTPNGAGLADKLTNAGARVAGAVAVAQTVGNVVQQPNLANGVTAAGAALLLIPNPYAQLGGLALTVTGGLLNAFKPLDNQQRQSSSPQPVPFKGGQGEGDSYGVFADFYNGDTLVLANNGTGVGRVGKITSLSVNAERTVITLCNKDGCVSRSVFSVTGCDNYRNIQLVNLTNPSDPYGDLEVEPQVIPAIQNDGYDPNLLLNLLNEQRDKLNDLSVIGSDVKSVLDQLKDLKQGLDNLKNIPNVENRLPLGLPIGENNTNANTNRLVDGLTNPIQSPSPSSSNPDLNINKNTAPTVDKTALPKPNSIPDLTKAPLPTTAPQTEPKTQPQTNLDRFKQPSDCNFSCSELAKCFVDLKVNIFDGCNSDNGTAKTKEITIQVLPKDKAKTEASFKELLDIRSRECSLNDKVITVPDHWQTRINQRPQAIVLYREFVNGKFTNTYYQQSIPHYNGSRKSRPNLTGYSKGTSSLTYLCKDNSKIYICASTDAEAKRIVNEFEKYINPRFRGEIVNTGTRPNVKSTSVKPVRLDFFSTGQIKLAPDWSIAL